MTVVGSENSLPPERPSHVVVRRLLAFGVMLAMAMLYRADRLTDWDSWDYASQAIIGQSSDLLLGRWWFIAVMRAAWLGGKGLLGLSVEQGYLMMQATCAAMMGGAVVVGMAWTRRLTRSTSAELLFAVMMALGPMFGIYATAVMTESLALLMLAGAWLLWDRAISDPRDALGRAMLAGMCFGVAVDIREPAALLCAWPIISCFIDRPKGRWALLASAVVGTALTLGVGVYSAMIWRGRPFDTGIAQWTQWMADERSLFPVSILGNARQVCRFAFMASPLATVAAIPALIWAFFRRRRLFWVAVSAGPYTATLLINHDLSVNPRFVLPLMLMVFPACAAGLAAELSLIARRLRAPQWGAAMVAAVASLATVGAIWTDIDIYYLRQPRTLARIYPSLASLPPDAMVIPGPGTPVAFYLRRIGAKQFYVIASGWDWPKEKTPQIVADAVGAGREVYVNIQPGGWGRHGRADHEAQMTLDISQHYRRRPVIWPMVQLLPGPDADSPASQKSDKVLP